MSVTRLDLFNAMSVDVPEGECDGLAVRRFTVTGNELADIKHTAEGRPCQPGEYTQLVDGDVIWMSDTTAERYDALDALVVMKHLNAKRVLINGLGLGMVVKAALTIPTIESIDVVESDPRVVSLVGPTYQRDPRVHVVCADAYEQARRWPRGSFWEVIWSDIWPSISPDHLEGMARLKRSYGRRCHWHGCWCQDRCRAMQREWKRFIVARSYAY